MDVSVVVIAYNERGYIGKCISSILAQTYKRFELVIVDDGSTDGTVREIKAFQDPRIRLFRKRQNSGYSYARNTGIENSNGEIIFFTDADCVVAKDWIEQGLKVFKKNKDIAGVTGRTYYVSKSYRPSIRDRYRGYLKPETYATRNIAYYKSELQEAGGFSLRYNYGWEDIELSVRILKKKRILFSKGMIVYHQKKQFVFNQMPDFFFRTRSLVYLKKDHPDYRNSSYYFWRICCPAHLLLVIFPPFLPFFLALQGIRIRKADELRYLFYIYYWTFRIRLLIWKTALKENVFII